MPPLMEIIYRGVSVTAFRNFVGTSHYIWKGVSMTVFRHLDSDSSIPLCRPIARVPSPRPMPPG